MKHEYEMLKPAIFLFLGLLPMAGLAKAGPVVYVMPSADGGEVVVAGPDLITVCAFQGGPQEQNDTSVGPTKPEYRPSEWVCEEYQGEGAAYPITVYVQPYSPVRVNGARWAWVVEEGKYVPMQGFATE